MGATLSILDRVKRHHTRPRPSEIDKLPAECEEDIVWAERELSARSTPQTEIRDEFNRRIAAKGHKPISKGSFSRHALRVAKDRREMQIELQLLDVALEMFPDLKDDRDALARELLKIRLIMAAAKPDASPKEVKGWADAGKTTSQKQIDEADAERRKAREERDAEDRSALKPQTQEALAKVDEVAGPAAERAAQIATEAGLSADRIAAIRKGVLGLAG